LGLVCFRQGETRGGKQERGTPLRQKYQDRCWGSRKDINGARKRVPHFPRAERQTIEKKRRKGEVKKGKGGGSKKTFERIVNGRLKSGKKGGTLQANKGKKKLSGPPKTIKKFTCRPLTENGRRTRGGGESSPGRESPNDRSSHPNGVKKERKKVGAEEKKGEWGSLP